MARKPRTLAVHITDSEEHGHFRRYLTTNGMCTCPQWTFRVQLGKAKDGKTTCKHQDARLTPRGNPRSDVPGSFAKSAREALNSHGLALPWSPSSLLTIGSVVAIHEDAPSIRAAAATVADVVITTEGRIYADVRTRGGRPYLVLFEHIERVIDAAELAA
ncbi:hypothetical protein GCM10022221_68260 [Actinocorallia aurea]